MFSLFTFFTKTFSTPFSLLFLQGYDCVQAPERRVSTVDGGGGDVMESAHVFLPAHLWVITLTVIAWWRQLFLLLVLIINGMIMAHSSRPSQAIRCSPPADVFKSALKFGTFSAVMVTYTASALLHVSNRYISNYGTYSFYWCLTV